LNKEFEHSRILSPAIALGFLFALLNWFLFYTRERISSTIIFLECFIGFDPLLIDTVRNDDGLVFVHPLVRVQFTRHLPDLGCIRAATVPTRRAVNIIPTEVQINRIKFYRLVFFDRFFFHLRESSDREQAQEQCELHKSKIRVTFSHRHRSNPCRARYRYKARSL